MKTCLLLCSLCFASFAMAQSPEKPLSPFEQMLIDQEKSVISAIEKHDKQTLEKNVTQDFVQAGVDAGLHDHHEAFGESPIQSIMPYNFRVFAAAENVAIVTYDAVVKSAPNEDDIYLPRYQRLSSLWVKQEDQWRLKFQQATAVLSE
jgi:hypothetical protein